MIFHLAFQVINDAEATLWDQLSVSCWPTLVVVSPSFKALTLFEGEGNRDALFAFVAATVKFYEERGTLVNKAPLPVIATTTDYDDVDASSFSTPKSNSLRLSYPGKVAISGRRIAVTDSANHRIVVGELEDDEEEGEYRRCVIGYVIGGCKPGFHDGLFGISSSTSSISASPLFRFPQGVTWWNDDGVEKLIVADTENHLVRLVTLPDGGKPGSVETLVGKPGKLASFAVQSVSS